MATYSFLSVNASIVGPGGAYQLGNGAAVADEGITVAMDEDKNTKTMGADGKGMHSLHASKAGTVTVRLLKTSPQNQKLSLMYALQTADPALHGSNVIVVNDTNRGDVITCRECAFKKLPDVVYSKDGAMNEWVFDSVAVDMLLGSGAPAL